jgi:hypothetical protein
MNRPATKSLAPRLALVALLAVFAWVTSTAGQRDPQPAAGHQAAVLSLHQGAEAAVAMPHRQAGGAAPANPAAILAPSSPSTIAAAALATVPTSHAAGTARPRAPPH